MEYIADHPLAIAAGRLFMPPLRAAEAGRDAQVALLCAILCCTATLLPGHWCPAPSFLIRDRAGCLMRLVSPASAMQEEEVGVWIRNARLPIAAAQAMGRLRGGGRRADTARAEQGAGEHGEIGPAGVTGSAVRGRKRVGRQARGNHTGSTAACKRSLSRMLREEEDRRLRQVSVKEETRVYFTNATEGWGWHVQPYCSGGSGSYRWAMP